MPDADFHVAFGSLDESGPVLSEAPASEAPASEAPASEAPASKAPGPARSAGDSEHTPTALAWAKPARPGCRAATEYATIAPAWTKLTRLRWSSRLRNQ